MQEASLPMLPTDRKAFTLNQPAYLTNNWRALQGIDSDKGYTQFVKVQNGVATITNGEALIRSYVGDIPDGFYTFTDNNLLVDSSTDLAVMIERSIRQPYYYNSSYSVRYPDPESVRPNFPALSATPPIQAPLLRQAIDFLNHLRSLHSRGDECTFVVFEGSTMQSESHADLWFNMGVQLPVNADYGLFRANTLRLIFVEMLRYDHVFIGTDKTIGTKDVRMPMVIGRDWSSCALIAPRR